MNSNHAFDIRFLQPGFVGEKKGKEKKDCDRIAENPTRRCFADIGAELGCPEETRNHPAFQKNGCFDDRSGVLLFEDGKNHKGHALAPSCWVAHRDPMIVARPEKKRTKMKLLTLVVQQTRNPICDLCHATTKCSNNDDDFREQGWKMMS